MLFKHFASKNQLPGLSVSGTLVENGLKFITDLQSFDNLIGNRSWLIRYNSLNIRKEIW